jgi:Family of unknown function (DUF5994)
VKTTENVTFRKPSGIGFESSAYLPSHPLTSENTMADSDTPHLPELLSDEMQQAVKPGTALLRLETTSNRQGILDGAWWPRSRDIAAELPGLIAELVRHLGPVTRVGLDANAWGELPTRLTIDDRVVHIDSFPVGDDTVLITRGDRDHFSLLVVPPQAASAAARAAMAKAVEAGNVTGAEHILIYTGTNPDRPGCVEGCGRDREPDDPT